MKKMQIVYMDAMEKLLPGAEPVPGKGMPRCARNGRLCFQVAFRGSQPLSFDAPLLTVRAEGSELPIHISKIALVPCTLPAYPDADDDYLTKTPCLIPDKLIPLEHGDTVRLLSNYWQSLWVEAYEPAGMPHGQHTITLTFRDKSGDEWGRLAVQTEVEQRMLGSQQFLHTEWLHLDCICQAHRCRPFSKRFWSLAEAYLRCQFEHGINVAWVPIFTPPLDTAVGKERMTVQMIGVTEHEGGYGFDFAVLEQWLDLCVRIGFTQFEFSHLFTQWGAAHAPKIVVKQDGGARKAFGWDTDAHGRKYQNFLRSLLPKLREFLLLKGLWENSVFHVSDEPTPENASSYRAAKALICEILPDILLCDALSDFSLYEAGLVPLPIPSIDKAEEFRCQQVENFWVYYSCVNGKDCPNRFLAMPLSRVRAIGKVAYDLGAKGFLHWGFNFWNCQHSLFPIDPNVVTDADGAFPSGDPFVVYPGTHGPLPSLRLKALALAMEDLRSDRGLCDETSHADQDLCHTRCCFDS